MHIWPISGIQKVNCSGGGGEDIGTILCAECWCCLSNLLGYWAQSWTGRHSDTVHQHAGTHFANHVWCGVRQEGVIPCRMVPSMWDEVHVQLHDVTGKVQQVRLCLPCKDARGASCHAGDAHSKFKTNQFGTKKKQTSLSGGHDFPGQG